MNRRTLVFCIFFLVLLLDQSLKIWVKTHMAYGEEFRILGQDWALIHFVENNGMAFGIGVGGHYGKLLLTTFRILVALLVGGALVYMVRSKLSRWVLAGFAFVLAGAWGNIIDSIFYGVAFSASEFHGGPATFLPEGGGYAPLFHGRVVDMLYFPIAYGTYPDWMPFVGGQAYTWISAIFNVADLSINLGVVLCLVHFFSLMNQGKLGATEEE